MFRFSEERVNRASPISTGAFGTIFEYKNKNSGSWKEWVVKEIICPKNSDLQRYLQEIVLSFNHNSPFIIHNKGFHIRQRPNKDWAIHIKMPRMVQSLRTYVSNRSNKEFTVAETVQAMYRICYGLNELKEKKIAHRDIKPENILLDKDNNVWIADLGLSSLVSDVTEDPETFVKGTAAFFPPELFLTPKSKMNKKDLYKVDAWSLGATIYDICRFKLPHSREPQTEVSLMSNKYGEPFMNILSGLLCPDVSQRKTFAETCEALEKEFPQYLEETLEIVRKSIKSSHREIVFDKWKAPTPKDPDVIEITSAEFLHIRKQAFKDGFSLAEKLNKNSGNLFNFHLGDSLSISAKDPLRVSNSDIKRLEQDLVEAIDRDVFRCLDRLSLDFSWCTKITDECLTPLKFSESRRKNIKDISFNFSECSQITDEGLKSLQKDVIERLINLESLSLDFSWCQKITEEGITGMWESIKSTGLKKISVNLTGCKEINFSEKELYSLVRTVAKLANLESLTLNLFKADRRMRSLIQKELSKLRKFDLIVRVI